MNKILVTNKNKLYIDPGKIFPCDSKQSLKVKFEFQKEWENDLKLLVLFKRKYDKSHIRVLDENFCCDVPHEVLTEAGVLSIQLLGIKYNNDYIYVTQGTNINENSEFIKLEYKDNIEFELDVAGESQVIVLCLPYINLLEAKIDELEVSLGDSGFTKNKRYKYYSIINEFGSGKHIINIKFNRDEAGINLNEDELIENLSKGDILNIIRSTVKCKVIVE